MTLEPGMRVIWPRGTSGIWMHGVLGEQDGEEKWAGRATPDAPERLQKIYRATDDQGHRWRVGELDLRPE